MELGGHGAGDVKYIGSTLEKVVYRLGTSRRLFQVKEGTEHRGAIESVVRVVRKTVCDVTICSRPRHSK